MKLQGGEKICKLAKDLNIPRNSISTWAKEENKQKIIREYERGNYVPENTAQCLEYISGIHTYFQSSKVPEHVLEALKTLEDHALKSSVMRRKKQCKITDMFKKD